MKLFLTVSLIADSAAGCVCVGVKMTDRVSTAVEDESSELCSSLNKSNSSIDEIPSLDALSFEHEHCPSRDCLCHHRKHLQNNRNSSGLSAFGVRTTDTPILTQKPASCISHSPIVKEPPSSLKLAQPTFQPLVLGCPIVVPSNTDSVPTGNTCDRVFGSGHSNHNVDGLQSFSQLCSTVHTSPLETAAADLPLTFEDNHRGCQLPTDPTHSAQEINLTELQSVLPTTAEESQPVSNCPVHQHANSVERFSACTCGQQASRLDDCTFEELAAYLDNFCYIPKNMSPMAEMMYM